MNKPFVIGITGGSGSGKTTFIRRIRENFAQESICIISMDDYYLPREMQHEDEQGEKNFDLPQSFDKKAFRQDLQRLINGETVMRQEYTFNNEKEVAAMLTFRPTPVIVVEGLFIFHYRKIAALFDLKIFVNAKDNLKIIRRIYRDRVERNYPLEDVLYKYEHHIQPSYERYIAPYQASADIVVNNNDNFDVALMVVTAFLEKKIKE